MPGVSIVGLIRFGGHLLKDGQPLRKARWAPLPHFPIRHVLTETTMGDEITGEAGREA